MTMLFPLLLFVIFIACVAFLYTEGMWGNAIRLINVVTAALLATNYWEPVARMLEGSLGSYSYYLDFLSLWGLFGVCMVIFRLATDMLSRVKLRFLKIADTAGSIVFAAWIGWVMVCFSAFTMHTAPLARNFLFGGFNPEARMFLGLAPDRQWLGFAQKMSRGTFSRTVSEDDLQKAVYGTEADPNSREQSLAVFDRNADFIPKYATRRAKLEAQAGSTGGGALKR